MKRQNNKDTGHQDKMPGKQAPSTPQKGPRQGNTQQQRFPMDDTSS